METCFLIVTCKKNLPQPNYICFGCSTDFFQSKSSIKIIFYCVVFSVVMENMELKQIVLGSDNSSIGFIELCFSKIAFFVGIFKTLIRLFTLKSGACFLFWTVHNNYDKRENNESDNSWPNFKIFSGRESQPVLMWR